MLKLGDDLAPGVDALMEVVHPQDRWVVGDLMQGVTRSTLERRYRVLWPDGSIRWHACFTDTLADTEGRAPVLTAMVEDVTTSHLYEAALARERRSYDGMVAMSGAVGWRSNALGVLDQAQSWCAFTGQGVGELQADGWLLALHPDDQTAAARTHAAAVAAGEAFVLDVRMRRRDGVHLPALLRVAPIPSPETGLRDWIAFAFLPPAAEVERSGSKSARRSPAQGPSAAQLRGCRGLLDWTVSQLAAASGVSAATIARYEAGAGEDAKARTSTLLKLCAAVQAAGIEFLDDGEGQAGIRLAT